MWQNRLWKSSGLFLEVFQTEPEIMGRGGGKWLYQYIPEHFKNGQEYKEMSRLIPQFQDMPRNTINLQGNIQKLQEK